MSRENVEISRRLMDAWNQRDLETLLALADPDVEYVNEPTAIEPGIRRGRDALVLVARKQWEDMPDGVQEIERFHDRGDEIITEGRLSRAMPGSDDRISTPVLMSWKFREGQLIRIELLGTGPEFPGALDAAGLSQ